jgi:predicted house-cleaning noncanonical NTP pyrophosphatase (MazG superfamily)
LGSYYLPEFLWYKNDSLINSIDTSLPVKLGYKGLKLDEEKPNILIDDISKCIEENYTDLEDDEIYTKLYNYIHEILKNDITDNNTIQLAKLDTVIKSIATLVDNIGWNEAA